MTNTVRALELPRMDTTAALKVLAEQAARLTGAEGVAIAMGNAMAMCCCASVGNAPEVGVLVGPDSGLSGICMRTSELVQCDDTASDSRVDPSRRTSLRSVLIVPIIADGRLQAMLQAVSSGPRAFDAQHRDQLSQIAEQIAQLLSEADNKEPRTKTTKTVKAPPVRVEPASTTPPRSAVPVIHETAPSAAAADAIAEAVAPAGAASEAKSAPALWLSRAASLYGTTSPAAWRSVAPRTKAVAGIVLLCLLAAGGYLAGRGSLRARAGSAVPMQASATATPALSKPGSDAAPEITVEQSSLSVAGLEEAPKVTGTAPQLVPGQLLRKADLVYPASARARGIGGSVVLTALVTREGRVANVRYVRGPQELATPAIDAVRQWVYEPYRLGGAPVAVETMIVIKYSTRQQH